MENPASLTKGAWMVRVAIAYLIAIGAGAAWLFLGPDTDHLWLDGLIADLIATLVIFAASRLHENSSFYDAFWRVLPPLLAFYWFCAGPGTEDVRWWLMAAVRSEEPTSELQSLMRISYAVF